MSLHACTECGYATVAEDANICPQCGTKNHAPMTAAQFIGIAAGIGAFLYCWVTYTFLAGIVIGSVVAIVITLSLQ